MNRNIFIKVVSLLMAGTMVAVIGGCSKSGKENNVVKNDIEQPTFENGTAVVEYYTTNEAGEKEAVTTVINNPLASAGAQSGSSSSNAAVAIIGDKLEESIKTDEEKKDFIDNSSEDYNISKEEADKIVDNAENWQNFSYNFFVANTNAKRIAARSVRAESTADVVVSTKLDCEIGIAPGSGMMISLNGIVNTKKYPSEEELVAALKTMSVKLVYTLTNEYAVEDWENADLKTMDIQF